MLNLRTSERFAGAAVVLLAALAGPALAETTELTGTAALAGETPAVTGVLSVHETSPLERTLELTMSNAETGEPITAFDEELTQELHVIATDSTFSTFVHEHAETAAPDGRLRVDMPFPQPGLYHIYTDAVPTGLGQQVLRFDLDMGAAQEASSVRPEPQTGEILTSAAGPYQIELDISGLRAGEESEVTLEILKEGRPAEDLTPYLEVPAHAVFIATDDLAYVHAHATAAEGGEAHSAGAHGDGGHGSGQTEAAGGHGEHGAEQAEAAASHSSDAHGHSGHGTEETQKVVPASLQLYVTPPSPGTYALWIQFMGGGEVRTAPFMISVE